MFSGYNCQACSGLNTGKSIFNKRKEFFMRFLTISGLLLVTGLIACSSSPPPQSTTTGSDRTVDGCRPTAGYAWCARTNQCERPWELGKKEEFAQTKVAFDSFCGNPVKETEG